VVHRLRQFNDGNPYVKFLWKTPSSCIFLFSSLLLPTCYLNGFVLLSTFFLEIDCCRLWLLQITAIKALNWITVKTIVTVWSRIFPENLIFPPLVNDISNLLWNPDVNDCFHMSPSPIYCATFRNRLSFYGDWLFIRRSTPQAGGSHIVGYPRLLPQPIYYFSPCLESSSSVPQPEDKQSRGVKHGSYPILK
jgi:hypothetical protein